VIYPRRERRGYAPAIFVDEESPMLFPSRTVLAALRLAEAARLERLEHLRA
jgi:hypothetical protein